MKVGTETAQWRVSLFCAVSYLKLMISNMTVVRIFQFVYDWVKENGMGPYEISSLQSRGWTQIEYQNKHYNINQKDEET